MGVDIYMFIEHKNPVTNKWNLVCDESFVKNSNNMISNEEIEKHGFWVEFCGMNIPDIRKCEDIAPYAIEPLQYYSFRQRKAKTVTVYE